LVDDFADFIGSVPARVIETPFGRSTCWEMGEGEPLVLLHGISGGRRLFFRVVPLLAQRYRVFVPLLRGEEMPARAFTLEDLLDDIHALLDALGENNVTLYGASFGGYLAMAYGGRRDPRVARIVCQAGFTRFTLRPLDRVSLHASALFPPRLGSAYFAWRVLKGRETGHLQEFAPGIDMLNYGWQRATPFVSLRQRTKLIARFDQSEAARRIEVPLRIAHAKRDPVVPFAAFEHVQRIRPDAHAEVWEEGGHMQMVTHPERFAELASVAQLA
jgi:pimeloyl-ACP methyl ester carboxylesterase